MSNTSNLVLFMFLNFGFEADFGAGEESQARML